MAITVKPSPTNTFPPPSARTAEGEKKFNDIVEYLKSVDDHTVLVKLQEYQTYRAQVTAAAKQLLADIEMWEPAMALTLANRIGTSEAGSTLSRGKLTATRRVYPQYKILDSAALMGCVLNAGEMQSFMSNGTGEGPVTQFVNKFRKAHNTIPPGVSIIEPRITISVTQS